MPLLLGACLSLWSLIYIYEVEMDMQVFNCAPLSPPTFNKKGVVINFLSVQHEACSMKGGVWESLYGFAIAGFVVYVAGFPVGVASWLYVNRERIMEDQLLRAKGVGEDRVTGPNTYEMRKAFGGLYFQFKPDYCASSLEREIARARRSFCCRCCRRRRRRRCCRRRGCCHRRRRLLRAPPSLPPFTLPQTSGASSSSCASSRCSA